MLEFSDKKVGKISIDITESDIENIIVGSFEGGSSYWMGVDNSAPEWNDKPKSEPLSTWATKLLLEGHTLKIYDIEDETVEAEITLQKILKGIEQNYRERPFDSILEDGDATTYDCIIQYAAFNELIYG